MHMTVEERGKNLNWYGNYKRYTLFKGTKETYYKRIENSTRNERDNVNERRLPDDVS